MGMCAGNFGVHRHRPTNAFNQVLGCGFATDQSNNICRVDSHTRCPLQKSCMGILLPHRICGPSGLYPGRALRRRHMAPLQSQETALSSAWLPLDSALLTGAFLFSTIKLLPRNQNPQRFIAASIAPANSKTISRACLYVNFRKFLGK